MAASVAVVGFVHAVAGIKGVVVIDFAVVVQRSGDGIQALLVPLAAVIALVGRIHVAPVADGWADGELEVVQVAMFVDLFVVSNGVDDAAWFWFVVANAAAAVAFGG